MARFPNPLPLAVGLVLWPVVIAPVPAQKRVQYDRELAAFFKELDKSYPFFAVKGIAKDWKATKKALTTRAKACRKDEDFVPIVVDAIRCLRDGHAGIVELRPKPVPPEPEFHPGLVLLPATEGRVVVAAVPDALKSNLPRGAIVEKIDGTDARQFLDRRGAEAWQRGGFFSSPQRAAFFEYRQPFRGPRGAKHTLVVTHGQRKRATVTVRSDHPVRGWLHLYNPPADLQQSAKSVYHTALDADTGYVWLRRMDASAEQGVAKAIAAHPTCKRWIVDLRGNTGGGYDVSFKSLIRKLGTKVAAIIDAGSVSAAETFTRDLVEICKARVFGARSAGSSSSKQVWKFPCGIASVRFSVRSRGGVGGKPIEFHGVEPDQEVLADPADVAAGRNTEILAAQAWLKGK